MVKLASGSRPWPVWGVGAWPCLERLCCGVVMRGGGHAWWLWFSAAASGSSAVWAFALVSRSRCPAAATVRLVGTSERLDSLAAALGDQFCRTEVDAYGWLVSLSASTRWLRRPGMCRTGPCACTAGTLCFRSLEPVRCHHQQRHKINWCCCAYQRLQIR